MLGNSSNGYIIDKRPVKDNQQDTKENPIKRILRKMLSNLPWASKLDKRICEMRQARMDKKDIDNLHKHWIDIMVECDAINKMYQTYGLNFTSKTKYGFTAECFLPMGLPDTKLYELVDQIECGLGMLVLMNRVKRERVVRIEFIKTLQEDLKFVPIVMGVGRYAKYNHPRFVYLGNDYSGCPIIVDLVKYPHILISGGTRSGK